MKVNETLNSKNVFLFELEQDIISALIQSLMDLTEKQVIVIDNGSSTFKAGFSGKELPDFVVPSLVGRLRFGEDSSQKNAYVGNEAQERRGILRLKYPIEYGVITNWDDIQVLWSSILSQDLKVNPKEHPVLLTEAPLTPKANRERMLQIWFETFGSPGVYVGQEPVLALASTGRVTGLSCDSGDGVTHIVPVYEGHAISHAIPKVLIGGRDVTDFLMKLLIESGHEFKTTVERETARDMKEKLCYVARDYKEETETLYANLDLKQRYVLPDGNVIEIGKERFEAPEIHFRPEMIGYEEPTLPELIYRSIMRCDIDIRRDLMCNINISGGNSMFPGMANRIKKELECLLEPAARIEVSAEPERKYAGWVGGSIWASLSTFIEMAISKDDYEEYGPSLVHKKCF